MRTLSERRLLVATHNAGKLDEMRALFAPHGIEVVGAAEMGLAEPEETETSFVGNARIKAAAAVKATGLPALADDSGICIDGLDGAPGVHTADWAETGNGTRDFAMAMQKVENALQDRGATTPEQRTGRFVSVLCLAWPDGHTEFFRGEVDGTIVWPPRGTSGFGYDPIFLPEGSERSAGELAPEEKDAASHRGRALRALVPALRALAAGEALPT